MHSATRVVTSTFGVLAALAGLEHGVGEVLQGNVRTAGLMIQSWPDAAFFRIEAGEPAMRIGASPKSRRTRPAPAIRRALSGSWPWAFAASIGAWLMLVPGLPILSYTLGVENPALVVALFFIAMGLLALAIASGRARDVERRTVTAHAVAR